MSVNRTILSALLLLAGPLLLAQSAATTEVVKPAAALEETQPAADSKSEDVPWNSYTIESNVAEELTEGWRVEDIVEPSVKYHYSAFGKTDPFVPPMPPSQGLDASDVQLVSVLQKYSIDQLLIVGIWQLSSGERKSLVLTPDGVGVTVKEGDPIGNQGGKVLTISDLGMTVREFFLSADGTRLFEDRIKEFSNAIDVSSPTVAPGGGMITRPVIPGGSPVPGLPFTNQGQNGFNAAPPNGANVPKPMPSPAGKVFP